MGNAIKVISQRELLAYRADVKGSIFRQIRERFARLKESGFTQKNLGTRIAMDEGQLSRRLRGDYDLQLETLSDLARGLECRIDVKLTPLTEVVFLPPPRPFFSENDEMILADDPSHPKRPPMANPGPQYYELVGDNS